MPLPAIAPAAVEDALKAFDADLRHAPEWQGWEQAAQHRWAIRHDGHLYPVLQVLRMATGSSAFHGGPEANGYLAQLGYVVVPLNDRFDQALAESAAVAEYTAGEARARGRVVTGGFLVEAGSTALARNAKGNYSRLKDNLLAQGVLAPMAGKPDVLTFNDDHVFASPSAAASVIAGYNVNGNVAWKNAEGERMFARSPRAVGNGPEAWKVSPGDNAWQWEECREGGFIAIGWDELGDVSGLSADEFDARVEAVNRVHPDWGWTRQGTRQALKFSQIQVGDRIVANRGTREVLGIGTVTGPYYFQEGVRQGHRLPVRWEDTTPRQVNEAGWMRTLIALDPRKVAEWLGEQVGPREPVRALIVRAVEALTADGRDGVTPREIESFLDDHAPRPDGRTWKESSSLIPSDIAVWADDQISCNASSAGSTAYPKVLERVNRTGEPLFRLRGEEAIDGAARRHLDIPARCWWASVGSDYRKFFEAGVLWAWQETATGKVMPHVEAIRSFQVGDLVLINGGARIVALGWVRSPAAPARRPAWIGPEKSEDGWQVEVDYQPLPQPLPVNSIPAEWREPEAGPFDADGASKSVYICPVDPMFVARLVDLCPQRFPVRKEAAAPADEAVVVVGRADYQAPPFPEIERAVAATGLVLEPGVLRRYHLALGTRGFVVLSGISGTGKTWLAEAYADAVGARKQIVPVAPNWNTNEDLLGYANPMTGAYHDTPFSTFLREAAAEFEACETQGRTPRPYHLILDEMNLARVEHYFAAFLSGMEVRQRRGRAELPLGGESVLLPPNLVFVGTVNIDETTHGFADKVYDRAHLIELGVSREAVAHHLGDVAHRDRVLAVWEAVVEVAPFAFRVLDDIKAYLEAAERLDVNLSQAIDEVLLHKVLPKVRGDSHHVGEALERLLVLSEDLPLSRAKIARMQDGYARHGIASFF